MEVHCQTLWRPIVRSDGLSAYVVAITTNSTSERERITLYRVRGCEGNTSEALQDQNRDDMDLFVVREKSRRSKKRKLTKQKNDQKKK